MDKTKKIEKNTEALDSKMSSAFFVSKKCYDKVMSIDFYRFNEDTGEEIVEKELKYRAMCLVYDLNRQNKENHKNENNSKLFGRNTLREYSYDWYTEILNKLEENDIIRIKQDFKKQTREIWINQEFLSDSFFKFPDQEYWDIIKKIKGKRGRRGRQLNSDGVHVDISKQDFIDIFKNDKDFVEEKYNNLYKNIISINSDGKLNPTQKFNNRCYSLFSNLPNEIHENTTINGRKLSEIDGHCSFFSLLPAVVDEEIQRIIKNRNKTEKTEEFLNELIKNNNTLRNIIKNTNDIYSLFIDETHDRNMIKKSFNAYLNDKDFNYMYKSIRYWFKENCPKINTLLRQMSQKNQFFYKIQRIEAQVYGFVAKKMKSLNIPVILKHDCLMTYREYIDVSRNMLLDRLSFFNLSQKIKTKHYETYDICSLRSQMTSSSLNSSTFVPLTLKPDNIDLSNNEILGTAFMSGLPQLKVQNTVKGTKVEDPCLVSTVKGTKKKRESNIKQLADGRWTIKLNGKRINSKKSETKDDFQKRVKIYEIEADERSEMSVANFKEDLINDTSVTILEKPVEAVSEKVVKEMTTDTEITSKRPTKVPRGVSVDFDMDVYKSMIFGGL